MINKLLLLPTIMIISGCVARDALPPESIKRAQAVMQACSDIGGRVKVSQSEILDQPVTVECIFSQNDELKVAK